MDRKDIVETLNDLIENCKDGELGFKETAEKADSPDVKRMLATRAMECQEAAIELERMVETLGGKPKEHGTVTGAMHRGWVSIRGALASNDDLAMLKECERGEDRSIKRYTNALEKPLPIEVRSVVERQYFGAKRNHDQIKAARDLLRRAA